WTRPWTPSPAHGGPCCGPSSIGLTIVVVKPVLYVGNRNYSSWSLRPWLVLRWGGIDFETRVVKLGGPGYTRREVPSVLAVSPGGTVPVLHLGGDAIGDSLAISEWAAEQIPFLWP